MLAEILNVRHASVRTTPLSASWSRRHLLASALDRLRLACGLAPDPDVRSPFRYLQLVFGSPGFRPQGETFAPTTRVLRPTIFDRSGDKSLPDWVLELPARRNVYATLGTVLDEPELLTSILEGFSAANVNVIVTVGRGRDADRFVRRPTNARICSYIPQSLLIPWCDLAVAHGGYNTILGCIDAGVPMVLLPGRGDQVQDAEWCASAGIARVLRPGHQTSPLIGEAVRRVLNDPDYRQRASIVRRHMQQQQVIERAVELVESLASSE